MAPVSHSSSRIAHAVVGSALIVAAAGVPLIVAPGYSFHFDVTPKTVLLLLAVALAAPFSFARLDDWQSVGRDRSGRSLLVALALLALSAVWSTALSERPALSLGGSAWRRMGLPTLIALYGFAAMLMAWLWRDGGRRRLLQTVVLCAALPISIYGVAQFFGIEPWQPKAYYTGEEEWAVVRPPSTLGHAGYLGVYLTFIAFWAGGFATSASGWRRGLGVGAVALSLAAILFSGTRGALVGLAAGVGVIWLLRPVRMRKRHWIAVSMVALGLAALVISPAGLRLRSRIVWSIEDFHGGSRPWLWRDAARMGARHWAAGTGVDTFVSEHPRYKSADLARRFPDQYQESAHNIILDSWAEQGLPGSAALLGLMGVAGIFAWRRRRQVDPWAAGAFAGGTVATQFLAFTTPTALYFLIAAVLVVTSVRAKPATPASTPGAPRFAAALAGLVIAAWLTWFALSLWQADTAVAETRALLAAGEPTQAVAAYDTSIAARPYGVTHDDWYARRVAAAAAAAKTPDLRASLNSTALAAAERAAAGADQRPNAFYLLAQLRAQANDAAAVQGALRDAIELAPTWYAPYWKLAQVLHWSGRSQEARRTAERALDLAGERQAEVRASLQFLEQAAAPAQSVSERAP